MLEQYRLFLEQSGFARNTVNTYVETVRLFLARYGRVNRKTLCEYKVYLIENYKPKTVNLRLNAINRYLRYLQKDSYILIYIKRYKGPAAGLPGERDQQPRLPLPQADAAGRRL